MRPVSVLFVAVLIALIGCGGGGPGGGTTTGNATGTTTGGPTDTTAYVTGQVVIDGFGTAIPGVSVYLTSDNGSIIATAVTDANGAFGINTVPTPTKIWIPKTSYNTAVYYSSFLFGAKAYSASTQSCGAPLPSLAVNNTFNLGNLSLILKSDPPPPPPTGCAP